MVGGVKGEPMINPGRQHDHITFFYPNPNPLVILVAYIKVPTTLQAVTDLFIGMHVLSEEVLQLFLIVFQLARAYVKKILQQRYMSQYQIRMSYTSCANVKRSEKGLRVNRRSANHVAVSSVFADFR
jgi:hypothetical protein